MTPSGFTSTCTQESFEHWYDPSVHPALQHGPLLTHPTGPLLAIWSSLTCQRCSTQMLIPKARHTCRYQCGSLALLITLPRPGVSYLPAGLSFCWWIPTCTPGFWDVHTVASPRIRHTRCEWLSYSSCWHGASHSPRLCFPPSNCSCGHRVFLPQWL